MNTRTVGTRRSVVAILALCALLAFVSYGAVNAKSGTATAEGSAAVAASPEALSDLFIVTLDGDPVAVYTGGIDGYAATSPRARGQSKLDMSAPATVAYLGYLDAQQNQVLAAIESALGRTVEVPFRYQLTYYGFAIRLNSDAEANTVAGIEGVVDIQRERMYELDTDRGPQWIGAPAIWDGSGVPGGSGTRGEGMIAGVLDTGINFDSPSFAATGPVDGYVHINPNGPGNYLGWCAANAGCNDKLIGAYTFVSEPTTPEDSDGHGSHTASTVAGNVVNSTITAPTYSATREIRGVAPHANIIAYDVCIETCPGAALLAAANQVAADGVDVVNYSISGGTAPYGDQVELAFLNAVDAGVYISASAGNSGPGASTVAHRGPWMMTVAAGTHDRQWTNSLTDLAGGSSSPPPFPIVGLGFTSGYGPAPIVYAGNYSGNNLCAPGVWAPGTFTNQIVVCDRGTYGRVEKGQSVLDAGGDGYVLANDEPNGANLVGDAHVLPAVHISYADGVALKAWLASGTGHTGRIGGAVESINAANGDIMASFSSRGPNTFDVIKPDIVAPGVDIWAAMEGDPGHYGFLSGTSMSSPHSAGAAVLMADVFPSWSPPAVKSAIMTSAKMTYLKEDGVTPADWFDIGAGRIDLTRAAKVGFILNETRANFLASNPGAGGDPKTLNIASMQNSACGGGCDWTRTLTSVWPTSVTYTTMPARGGNVFVDPPTFTLAPGGTQEVRISYVGDGTQPLNTWIFDSVMFMPNAGPVSQTMPIAVKLTAPTAVTLGNMGTAGNSTVPVALALGAILVSIAGLVVLRRNRA